MNTHRINIFNATNNDYVVGGITHNLKFVFLPTQNRFLEKNFRSWTMAKTCARNLTQIIFIKGDPGTESPHCERWTNYDRIIQDCRSGNNFLHCVTNYRLRRFATNLFNNTAEEFSIFSSFNCIHIRANEFGSITI